MVNSLHGIEGFDESGYADSVSVGIYGEPFFFDDDLHRYIGYSDEVSTWRTAFNSYFLNHKELVYHRNQRGRKFT